MDVNLLGQTDLSKTPSTSPSLYLRMIWHKSAPDAVRKAYRSGRNSKGWSAWTKHLAKRSRPVALSDLLPGKTSPLAWSLPEGAEKGDTPGLIEQLARSGRNSGAGRRLPEEEAVAWLDRVTEAPPDAGYPCEALAWGHALPRLADDLPPEVWWKLLEHLLGDVAEADRIEMGEDLLGHQLLAGELPLALAYLFPEISACRKLGREARRALSAGLVDVLDGEGLPHARHLGLLRPLLACWTRCRAIGNALAKGCWNGAAQTQYEWLIRHALRLTRFDGTHVFSRGPGGAWCKNLFDAAVRQAGDEDDRRIASLVLPGRKRADAARSSKIALPKAATHSEWSEAAVLRPGWKPEEPRLAVTYSGESVRLELECAEEILWSGAWDLEVSRDGERLQPHSSWEEICWISDDDADYLELELEFEAGLRVQRHLLLAREDHVLFLADAILGDRPAELEYRGVLPLADGISFHPAGESREGFLRGRGHLALGLPLALPEWRGAAGSGELVETDRGLELRQQARARAMMAPLFFDLRAGRMTHPFTWRQLTVAENLKIQPPEVAVGYRVMVGKEQWLIYRSLAPRANRTLLGHNLATEMLVARFGRDGEVEPLVEIE